LSFIDDLLAAYKRFVSLPWPANLPGPERVWMVVYPPFHERRIRFRLGDFEAATRAAGHGWRQLDLTNSFPKWLGEQEYAEAYFDDPEALRLALEGFVEKVTEEMRAVLEDGGVDDNAVVAVIGTGALYPFAYVAEVIEAVSDHIRGRLVVFFPGDYENNVYRLLSARNGWNYRAVPITASKEWS
jgi:hypothetical protein